MAKKRRSNKKACKKAKCCCDNKKPCEDNQAVTDIIMSVALEQTALSHIMNAEGEKMQKALTMDLTPRELICVNSSIEKTLKNIIALETSLFYKLRVFEQDY